MRGVGVTMGVEGGEGLEIAGGRKGGDEIVTAGTDVLANGSPIRPIRNLNPYTGVTGPMAAEAPASPADAAAPPAKKAN